MMRFAMSILGLCLVGCVPNYQNRLEMPQPLQDNLSSVESEYLAMAVNEAASITGCSAQSAAKEISSTSREKFMIQYPTEEQKASYVTEEKITAISVNICDEAFTFNVQCGAGQEYAALVLTYPVSVVDKAPPCQVVLKK